jgi:hypothetical protein
MITVPSFRRDFTEFVDATIYPNTLISYYLRVATVLLNQARFGSPSTTSDVNQYTEWDIAAGVFIAHHLSLEMVAIAEAANGGPPGIRPGVISAESVDKVSINYDNAASVDEGAGHWNQTVYGKRFIRFARMFGAGPVQLGVPTGTALDPLNSSQAYQGPWQNQTPNPSG